MWPFQRLRRLFPAWPPATLATVESTESRCHDGRYFPIITRSRPLFLEILKHQTCVLSQEKIVPFPGVWFRIFIEPLATLGAVFGLESSNNLPA